MRLLNAIAASAMASFVGTCLLLHAPSVCANEPRPTDTSQADDATGPKLEEIIVTATRREASVEKVPISIAALSQSALSQGGIKGITDIAAATPSLQFASPQGFSSTLTTISIRGMNTATGASVVGIYLDDTPIQSRLSFAGNVGSPYPVAFDMNRVEVDRGPQGTLFGAGSEAGTLRFITNSPSLTEFSGYTHEELATTEGGALSYEAGVAAGGPIVEDKVGFRASVWDRRDGGFVNRVDPITGAIVDRNANSNEKLALRVALAFRVNDNILITPSVYYQRTHIDDTGRFWVYRDFSEPSTGHFNNGNLLPEVSTDPWVLPSLKVEAHLPFADLTSTTSYLYRKLDELEDVSAVFGAVGAANYGSPRGAAFPTSQSDVAPTLTGLTVKGFTQEVRLTSNQHDVFATWVAGIFYDHRSQLDFQTSYSRAIDPTGANVYDTYQLITDDQVAVFAQSDLHLSSKLTATLGARVAKVKSDVRITEGTGFFNVGEPPVAYAASKETPITPRVALSYQADSNNLFYTSVGKGFRIGGGNAPVADFCNTTAPTTYSSDYVWSYEVGAKNTLFDGKVQIDSSAFHVDWSKIQQLVQLPCGLGYTVNAGSAALNGFDLAVQALVTDRLRVNLNLGYVDAYFTKNVYGPSGAPLVLSGDKVGLLPQVNSPWDVNTSATYTIPLSQGATIHLRGEYQYHSRNPGPFITQIPTSPSYYPLIVADPPTHLFNVRLGATMDKWDFTLFVDNLFNSHPLLGASSLFSATSNLLTDSTLRPRTVGLSANFEF
jgi:iron complex outermembrane receptor protein